MSTVYSTAIAFSEKPVLVVKTSSLGDVIHTLPAVSDAAEALPGIRFDWVVEESFAAIPTWHPAVRQVVPVALRRWRKHPMRMFRSGEWHVFRQRLQEGEYDLVIDAQGLLKSALLTCVAPGLRVGLDRASIRESLATLAYQKQVTVPWGQHAIDRVRQLFGQALGYSVPNKPPNFAIQSNHLPTFAGEQPDLVFFHATTWITKHWPEVYWLRLARLALASGMRVGLPWASKIERARALRIVAGADNCTLLPRLDLSALAGLLAHVKGVVGVDTGLAHLASALHRPLVTIYGSTKPDLTGTVGRYQQRLQAEFPCAPCLKRKCNYSGISEVYPACYAQISPELVWASLQSKIRAFEGQEGKQSFG